MNQNMKEHPKQRWYSKNLDFDDVIIQFFRNIDIVLHYS